MGEIRNLYKILVEKLKEKTQLGRSRSEDNIKMDV
jgi:hypothetical protein